MGGQRALVPRHAGRQSREGRPTARPLILRGLISMNRFGVPVHQGTGPVSQADMSRSS